MRRTNEDLCSIESGSLILQLQDYSTIWALISSLADKCSRDSSKVSVLRIKSGVFGSSSSIPAVISKVLSKPHPLASKLMEIGASYENLGIKKFWKTDTKTQGMDEESRNRIKRAAMGQAVSVLRDTSRFIISFFAKKLASNLESEAIKFYFLARYLAENNIINEVYIPNGRMASEMALTLGFRDSGVKVFFYEASIFYQRGFLSEHSPQDLASHDDHAILSVENCACEFGGQAAEKWAESMRSPENKFFNARPNQKSSAKSGKATYFSSSSDEFLYLPQDWGYVSDNFDQWDRLSKWLQDSQFFEYADELRVRVHPNFRNKGFLQNLIEIKKLRSLVRTYPKIVVYGPNSRVNTYVLLDDSRFVITDGSTIGLEAIVAGKNVITLSKCSYSQLISTDTFRPIKHASQEEVNRSPVKNLSKHDLHGFFCSYLQESFELSITREYFHRFDPKLPLADIRLSWIPTGFSIWTIVSIILRLPTKILVKDRVFRLFTHCFNRRIIRGKAQ